MHTQLRSWSIRRHEYHEYTELANIPSAAGSRRCRTRCGISSEAPPAPVRPRRPNRSHYGGSRGLGLVLARAARAGARVAICGRDAATLDRARGDLERRGAPVLALPCDVTIREDVDALIREVGERLGPIDVLINNAGIISVGPVETMEVEDFQQAMATNFWGLSTRSSRRSPTCGDAGRGAS